MSVFPKSIQLLGNAIDAAVLQQRSISSNIANADTPHYKRKSVDFQTYLDEAMGGGAKIASIRTNEKHLPFRAETGAMLEPKIEVNSSTIFQSNGNNVDMDKEMAELAKNQLWYNALVDNMNIKFRDLKAVISDRR